MRDMQKKIASFIALQIRAIRNVLLGITRRILHLFGAEITGYERNPEVARLKKIFGGLIELSTVEKTGTNSDEANFLIFAQKHLHLSKSQILQDLFVLYELQDKEKGYFVEFGATNGVDSSNSFLLEKHYCWNGILAEPGRIWHEQLRSNRDSRIDCRCVWSETGQQLEFNEVREPELSTIHAYSNTDRYSESRQRGARYYVDTVSLNELLEAHCAPADIDYLSIDTEGSEFEILSNLDFAKYQIKVITCEHNYTEARERIFKLLTSKGYVRKFEVFSQVDDWYVKT